MRERLALVQFRSNDETRRGDAKQNFGTAKNEWIATVQGGFQEK
jgi:hypothetical protein